MHLKGVTQMKKIYIGLLCIVLLGLCGCGTAPIEESTAPAPKAQALPLQQNEMIIPQASVNDIVKRFGQYESFNVIVDVNGGHIELHYALYDVELASGD